MHDDVIKASRHDLPIQDSKLKALRQFSIIVNQTRGWPEDVDVLALIDAGYSRQTVLEVVLGTAFKVLPNYTNHIAAADVDAAFASNKWSTAGAKAA